MPNLLNSIQLQKPKKNVFDLSHDVKLSGDMGELIPTACIECVPGDSFTIGCHSLLRFAPMTFPVMHKIDVYMHYFFVPNRLLWNHWEQYITGDELQGPSGPSTSPVIYPYFFCGGPGSTSNNYTPLCDYMGIPTPLGPNTEVISTLPFLAYQMIWNEYYRDQNLILPLSFPLGDGDTTAVIDTYLTLRNRAWEHDYFTAALPWAQKGAAVDIPLGVITVDPDSTTEGLWRQTGAGHPLYADGAASLLGSVLQTTGSPGVNSLYDPNGTLIAEPTTINDLRRAFRLQEWLERNARGGTRYTENILAHFGVKSSDKRLQRPEYITGTKSPVVISEVLNTTGTADQPQGDMAGHGVSVTSGKYGRYFCEEHGYIIGIMSVMPKTAYQQGIPKHFTKTDDRFQFYWPEFANIGEQEVANRELYAFQGSPGLQTFGYIPRYAEYKFMPSRVAGDFRNTPLDAWHLGRIFTAPPVLDQAFVECVPDQRIFNVIDPDFDKLYAHVFHDIKAVRPMPKFGTPSF